MNALLLLFIMAIARTCTSQSTQAIEVQTEAEVDMTRQLDVYIVLLKAAATATYMGGEAGIDRTQPDFGSRINESNPAVNAYRAHLRLSHEQLLSSVGIAPSALLQRFTVANNGFAIVLNDEQATAIAKYPDVISVTRDTPMYLSTYFSATDLGLDQKPSGLWSTLRGPETAGQGIVIGIVDTGIWPEHPSFSGNSSAAAKKIFQAPLPRWKGKCEGSEAAACNGKIVGCRTFQTSFIEKVGSIKKTSSFEFDSCRDSDGHGSHVASTAAGLYGVELQPDAATKLGRMSGMAPAARIAVYKACWRTTNDPQEGNSTCMTSDIVKAIDQAVIDGVDVINLSLGGSLEPAVNDPIMVSVFNAAAAGVFTAASVGNLGPRKATADHVAPWVTAVGAATTSRVARATLQLRDGRTFQGASQGPGFPYTSIVSGAKAVKKGAKQSDASICAAGSIDPVVARGKVLLCERSLATFFSTRVQEAQRVGAVGVTVLSNSNFTTLPPLAFDIPFLILPASAAAAVRTYSSKPNAAAQQSPWRMSQDTAAASQVASFSSRGPVSTKVGVIQDVLKPDLLAPGVGIFGATSPANPANKGRLVMSLDGSSMASPHIAGIAALLKQLHPTWSPMALKSALMTTASMKGPRGRAIKGGTLDYGAGQVSPTRATNPGLVFESGPGEWDRFLCAKGYSPVQKQNCAQVCQGPEACGEQMDLNMPYIVVSNCLGTCTVQRTVRNVGDKSSTYVAVKTGLKGLKATVTPRTFTLQKGASVTLTISITLDKGGKLGQFISGQLLWRDGSHSVSIPLAVKMSGLTAPRAIKINYPADRNYRYVVDTPSSTLTLITSDIALVTRGPDTSAPVGAKATSIYKFDVPKSTLYLRLQVSTFFDCSYTLSLTCGRRSTLLPASGNSTVDRLVPHPPGAAPTCNLMVSKVTSTFKTAKACDFNSNVWFLRSTRKPAIQIAVQSVVARRNGGYTALVDIGVAKGVDTRKLPCAVIGYKEDNRTLSLVSIGQQ